MVSVLEAQCSYLDFPLHLVVAVTFVRCTRLTLYPSDVDPACDLARCVCERQGGECRLQTGRAKDEDEGRALCTTRLLSLRMSAIVWRVDNTSQNVVNYAEKEVHNII